ncbi:MAG: hypothetical protein M0002_09075, partial [Rhodospirillales bacterium]|nr:hypothetical protein [Rhodospirillales bacterium]
MVRERRRAAIVSLRAEGMTQGESAGRMVWNRSRGTITSAIWNVIERPCRTILAPIFTSRSRSVVSDH